MYGSVVLVCWQHQQISMFMVDRKLPVLCIYTQLLWCMSLSRRLGITWAPSKWRFSGSGMMKWNANLVVRWDKELALSSKSLLKTQYTALTRYTYRANRIASSKYFIDFHQADPAWSSIFVQSQSRGQLRARNFYPNKISVSWLRITSSLQYHYQWMRGN